jgi:hypothetical protein
VIGLAIGQASCEVVFGVFAAHLLVDVGGVVVAVTVIAAFEVVALNSVVEFVGVVVVVVSGRFGVRSVVVCFLDLRLRQSMLS